MKQIQLINSLDLGMRIQDEIHQVRAATLAARNDDRSIVHAWPPVP
jgi:hypothetical protein